VSSGLTAFGNYWIGLDFRSVRRRDFAAAFFCLAKLPGSTGLEAGIDIDQNGFSGYGF